MFRLAWVDLISLRLPLSSPGFPVTSRHFIREKAAITLLPQLGKTH